MIILALDTSTPYASIAVTRGGQIAAESLLNTDRTLSSRLIPEMERLAATVGLTLGDIDLFASSLGPGSFTGVRGGVATVQGLALATGTPCFGFSSLAMLAMNLPFSTTPVCPLLDARKSEVYGAVYDCSGALPLPVIADCVLPPAAMFRQIAAQSDRPVIFLGDGALRYHDLITETFGAQALFPPFSCHTPRAANGALLALRAAERGELLTPGQLLPTYLRGADAVKMAARIPVA